MIDASLRAFNRRQRDGARRYLRDYLGAAFIVAACAALFLLYDAATHINQ